MLTLLSEIKFIATSDEEQLLVKNADYGSFRYHEKNESDTYSSSDYVKCFYDSKKDYAKKRGLNWVITNKHPHKLRASLKQLEEEINGKKVAHCNWITENIFQLFFSNGLLVYIELDAFSGEIRKINFDKYFVGKLISENISDLIYTRQYFLISYDEPQITYVYLQKPTFINADSKISAADPKIFNIIIGGGQMKKLKRNMIVNKSNDLVVIWTNSSQSEFYPWRPCVKDQDRANFHLYKLNRMKLEPLCFYWTENHPIGFEFSKINEKEIYSVEQKISRKGEVIIETCTYEYIINQLNCNLRRTSITLIPLQTEVSCYSYSPDHEKLLIGCIDGSIVLFDASKVITYLVRASFIPSVLSFHPDSAIFAIANERGQLQFFDISLSCIKNQLLSEDFNPSNIMDTSSFFAQPASLIKICWSKKVDVSTYYDNHAQVDAFLLLLFDKALSTIRFVGGNGLVNDVHTSGLSMDVLIHEYLALHQIERATNILLSFNWDSYGAMCLLSLHKIANYIFSNPNTPEHEELLERALRMFYVPHIPLCSETENEFGDNVDDITRRFFHYLLRYKSFEKAYRLAIDINDKDLFIILYKCAKAHGQINISSEAFRRAQKISEKEDEDELESNHTTCSISSCLLCSNSSDSESYQSILEYETENNHPPLPDAQYNNVETSKHDDFFLCQEKDKELKKSSELTLQNLKKFNNVSSNSNSDIEQTVQFSLSNILSQEKISKSMLLRNRYRDKKTKNKTNNEYPTTSKVHNYPLISGTIPSLHNSGLNKAKKTLHATQLNSKCIQSHHQKEILQPILTNTNTPSSNAIDKKSGEKNKVKFSDTITVAVVPEIPRKEKVNNFNERLKKKTIVYPITLDLVKKELAESLPLCHPHQEYLKDFMPAIDNEVLAEEKGDKSSIRVINLGIL